MEHLFHILESFQDLKPDAYERMVCSREEDFVIEIGEVRVSSVTCFAEDRMQRKIDITESAFGGYGNTANAEL